MISKNELDYLEKRVQRNFLAISDETYLRSLLDITEFLWYQLAHHLEEENRYFGITRTYINNIKEAFKKANQGCTSDDCDIYGKTLYLYKPLIIKEYRKLINRRLSKADCIIVIIKRFMEYIMKDCIIDFKISNHPQYKEMKTLDKIITKLYDNIRHNGKSATLDILFSAIKKYQSEGLIGKYVIDSFFLDEEAKWKEKTKFQGDNVKIETTNKLMEVEWTEKI